MAFYPDDDTVTIGGVRVPLSVVEKSFPQFIPQPLEIDSTLGPRGTGPGPGTVVPPLEPPPPATGTTLGPRGRGSAPPVQKIGPGIGIQDETAIAAGPRLAPEPAPQSVGFSADAVSGASPIVPMHEPAPAEQAPPDLAPRMPQSRVDVYSDLVKTNERAKQAGREIALAEKDAADAETAGYVEQKTQIDAVEAERQKHLAEVDRRMADNRIEIARLAKMPITREVRHPVTAALSAVLAGIGSAMKNDSGNAALDLMFKQLDRQVQDQMAESQRRQGLLGMQQGALREQRADINADYEKRYIAALQRTKAELNSVASQLTSATALKRAEQANAAIDTKTVEMGSQLLTREEDQVFRESQFAEQQRAARVGEKQSQQQLGLGYANLGQRKYEFGKTYDLQVAQIGLEAQKLAAAGNAKAAEMVFKQGVQAPARAVEDADGNLTTKRDILRQEDGTPFVAPTEDEAKQLRARMAQTQRVVDIVDEIRGIRERVGGESEWGNSDDYQRLQVLKDQIVVMRKNGEQGFSSDSDMMRIEGMLGVKDPASFRAQAAGLDEGRKQTIKNINTNLRHIGNYTGKELDWADPLKNKAPLSEPELAAKTAVNWTFQGANKEELASELGVPGGRFGASNPKSQTALRKAVDEKGPPQHIRRTIDSFSATINNPKATQKQREQASYLLGDLAAKAMDPATRAYALQQQSLALSAAAGSAASPEVPQ